MLSWFRRYGYMALTIAAVTAVFGPMFLTIANKAPNYEPSRPSIAQGTATDPFVNIQRPKGFGFEVRATDCTVQYPGVSTSLDQGVCSVTIDRSTYPYVSGTGTSCQGIDLTWADNYLPERGRWVIRLQGKGTSFTFAPYTLDRLNAELKPGPAPVFEFRGTVKDPYGEGTVSCGMLPAK